MPVRIEANFEPIPGYRLIERLGGGGFGEVWKCQAPGGLFKAIKFVYGDMESIDDDAGSRAEQELKALNRVKTVHHPYILSLERYDIIEGQLMIVMELADRTVWDRFKECRSQGLPGIPRQELLGYMRETAEALDLMYDQFQLQHLDIKPQNLFLIFNHIKVADFGLVKDLGTKAAATITGGVTPVYAAPETFDGWLSRFSDQYSLAIVYQELLTGIRPFTGATMRQLVLQHLQGTPDLNPLVAADRPIVARALSKSPDHRFPCCLEFIQQLMAATTPPPSQRATVPTLDDVSESALTDTPETQGARGKSTHPSSDPDSVDGDRPNVLPPRPDYPQAPSHDQREGGLDESMPPCQSVRATVPAVRRSPAAADPAEPGATGPIQPTLVIGLGGIGLQTLAALRRRLTNELAQPEELPLIRLLGIDTDPDAIQAVSGGLRRDALQSNELLTARLHRVTHYRKGRDGKSDSDHSAFDRWLSPKVLYRIPRHGGSAGLRPLGRLAFMDHREAIAQALEREIAACAAAAAVPPLREPLGPRSRVPRVCIVACLSGNSGSGMFLDAAFVAREQLRRLGHARAEIVGVFYLPADGPTPRPAALANAFAALTELQYYSRSRFGGDREPAEQSTPTSKVLPAEAPFTRCMLVGLPPGNDSAASHTSPAVIAGADFLYRDLATPLGASIDEQRRRRTPAVQHFGDADLTLHDCGLKRISWPRQPLLEHGARRVCRRLVESWMSKDARRVAQAMANWADQHWDAVHLRPEALIGRLHEMCEKIVKQPPDRMVTAITAPLAEAMKPRDGDPNAALAVGPAVAALAELDRLLGVPEECRPTNQVSPPPGVLELALSDAGRRLADICDQRLTEQVVCLIEDPQYRLVGAEEALRQLSAACERALQAQETLASELHERATLLYQRAQKMLESPLTSNVATTPKSWKLSFTRRTPSGVRNSAAADLIELIRQYPKARYHALVLAQINRLYLGLRGQLSDQLREVGFCRQRLGELANLLQPAAVPPNGGAPDDTAANRATESAAASTTDESAPSARVLLPAGCTYLDEAIAALDSSLTPDDLLVLDNQIQVVIRKQYRALVNLCMGTSAMVRTLAPAMLSRAQKFLEPRLGETSVADLLLARHSGDADPSAAVVSDLQDVYKRAAPRNASTAPDARLSVAQLPHDAAGERLQPMLAEELPELSVLESSRLDEIVIYREHIYQVHAALDQLGAAGHDAYHRRRAADPNGLHTREDIPEWQPLAAVIS